MFRRVRYDLGVGATSPSWPAWFRRPLWMVRRSTQCVVGICFLSVVLAIAFLGPSVAPYDPADIVGLPFEGPSSEHLLGTDVLGRDAFSRYLNGGRQLILVAAIAVLLASVIGVTIGMIAGYRRGFVDTATVASADLLLAFPPIVFILVLIAAAGSGLAVVIAAIAASHIPRVARLTRATTVDVAQGEFVESAVARGDPVRHILRKDILPNIAGPYFADIGVRFTGSILLFSALSYLGLGARPPAADWGLMISENRAAITGEPIMIIVPALTIALLAIAVNLTVDGMARGGQLGRRDDA